MRSFKALADAAILRPNMQIQGEEAVYQPASSDSNPPDAFTIRGVWSGPHQAINLSAEGPEYSTTQPSLGVRLADFDTAPRQDDIIIIFGTYYQVIDVQPDGQGAATLILQLA